MDQLLLLQLHLYQHQLLCSLIEQWHHLFYYKIFSHFFKVGKAGPRGRPFVYFDGMLSLQKTTYAMQRTGKIYQGRPDERPGQRQLQDITAYEPLRYRARFRGRVP